MINQLNVLYLSKDRFQEWIKIHNTKIMFRFAFEEDIITLTGWAPKKRDNSDDYDENDVLELTPNLETRKLTGTRLYFGNIRLSKKEVVLLKKISKPIEIKYLLFVPQNYSEDSKQIAYKVLISKTTSTSDKIPFPKIVAAPPSADPSPPATRK